MKLTIAGATGLVGKTFLKALEEELFQFDELILCASEKSVGSRMGFRGREYELVSLGDALRQEPDIALFSAGAAISREWGPRFAEAGCRVVDNSSAWRMDPHVKLIVPEVNGHLLSRDDYLIANPNCSTIQMVAALAPLHRTYGIKRLVISTYQAITGTGQKAVRQYELEKSGQSLSEEDRVYPHPILENCLPHCDVFLDNGYTKEEMKLVHETRKILEEPDLPVTATAVRVPVLGGHSESVNVELKRPFSLEDVRQLLSEAPGVVLQDEPATNTYPMPLSAKDRNEVFVGRLRRDESIPNGLNLWIVADNLRKGAATNAVQIARMIQELEA
ncbi:MAG TPA: aspartate-semialdehyde dehydrogenase [Phaeodactylibacter sp.]|nr:aspartate-semialdehyde dehydrogenase [Phaeodactylibacter sp.]